MSIQRWNHDRKNNYIHSNWCMGWTCFGRLRTAHPGAEYMVLVSPGTDCKLSSRFGGQFVAETDVQIFLKNDRCLQNALTRVSCGITRSGNDAKRALFRCSALASASFRTSDEDQLFAELSAAIAILTPEQRAALDSSVSSASARRSRERAELYLRRELVARGIVSG